MARKPKSNRRERLPFAVVLALIFLGNDLFNAGDEFLRLITGLSTVRTFLIIDLLLTVLLVPCLIWGIWNRLKWSRWLFVGYNLLTILMVSAIMLGEIATTAADRVSLLTGYYIAIAPSLIITLYFGKSKSAALYLGCPDKQEDN